MKMRWSDLWRWDGEITRGVYAAWGVLLFAIKYNLDRALAEYAFGRVWSPLNYVLPGRVIELASHSDMKFCLAMLALALPFIWAGVVLTLRRIRSVGWPLGLTVVFFLPFLNFAFFTVLLIVPPGGTEVATASGNRPKRWLDRVIPHGKLGSAVLGMFGTTLLGLGATLLSVEAFQLYGWGLFVLVPFCCGLLSVLLYGYHESRSLGECIAVSLLSVAILGGVLMAVAMEGLICILMAAPLAGGLAVMGGLVGYAIQCRDVGRTSAPPVIRAMGLAVPLLLATEHFGQPTAPLLEVRTAIEIAAPPARVWPEVVAFTQLPPPTEWLFRAGIAYPERAEIKGQGAGAIRYCIFSTGPFVEPIEVWDEPRLLRFGVTENPSPMEEWTPYANVHPPHLDGYLVSEHGQFLLTPLANGKTRLEGTTWYRHHLWPSCYWQYWSDFIIHQVHQRVLLHIKRQAEQTPTAVRPTDAS
jgi:hypothetical protein